MGLDFRRPKHHFGFRWGEVLVWAQNSGKNIRKLISGISPLTLIGAVKSAIVSIVQNGKVERPATPMNTSIIQEGKCVQNGTPAPDAPVDIRCNNGTLVMADDELPEGYRRIESIDFNSSGYYNTNEKLYGTDVVTMTISNLSTSGQNLFGCYSGTGDDAWNFSLYVYGSSSGQAYWRYGQTLYRPVVGSTGRRTIRFGAGGTIGFNTNSSYSTVEFETTDVAYIGALPNSSSTKFSGQIIGTITVGNRLRYIPCIRVSDGTVGYYEKKKGVFLEPSGTSPTAGAYDTSHLYPQTDGNPEILNIGNSQKIYHTFIGMWRLLAAGDNKDTVDFISGTLTKNVGVKILDGTETITESDDGYAIHIANKLASKVDVICTHYPYSSATMANAPDKSIISLSSADIGIKDSSLTTPEDVAQFFVDQVAAGTPVIVVYPLAQAVTEQTSAKPQLANGSKYTTVTVTAEISGIVVTFNTGTQVNPDPYVPVDIKCNNGVLKYESGGIYVDGNDEAITLSSSGAEDQTASAADLFAVGDYEDTQDIISGAVARNVGIKVLDGTENWERPGSVDYFILDGEFSDAIPYSSENPAIACTHFNGRPSRTSASNMSDKDIKLGYTSTYNRLYLKFADMKNNATTLKSWLAAQYAAGTPVIVLYPLATPATETVTPQPLSTEEGDNTMTVTAEVSDIEFDVTYMAQN